jgi:hypothetical protein
VENKTDCTACLQNTVNSVVVNAHKIDFYGRPFTCILTHVYRRYICCIKVDFFALKSFNSPPEAGNPKLYFVFGIMIKPPKINKRHFLPHSTSSFTTFLMFTSI